MHNQSKRHIYSVDHGESKKALDMGEKGKCKEKYVCCVYERERESERETEREKARKTGGKRKPDRHKVERERERERAG